MYNIIINPASKSGKGIFIWKELEPVLEQKNIDYRVMYSEREGHIAQLIRDLMQSDTANDTPVKVILLGGDGTVNEAIQGIDDFSKIQIGYIPTGSSNDLARDLCYPKSQTEILENILAQKTIRKMDVGVLTCNGKKRRFLVSCGIGFDAAVCEQANRIPAKKLLNRLGLGKLVYVLTAIGQLIKAKNASCKLQFEGHAPIDCKKFLFTAFMVHRYEGGGFMFCPSADYSDRLMDLCVVGHLPKPVILLALPTAFFGKHLLFKNIDAYQASEFTIETSIPLWYHTDGEVSEMTQKATISMEEAQVQFLY